MPATTIPGPSGRIVVPPIASADGSALNVCPATVKMGVATGMFAAGVMAPGVSCTAGLSENNLSDTVEGWLGSF